MSTKPTLRSIPSIDSLLKSDRLGALIAASGRDRVRDVLREILEGLRTELRDSRFTGGEEEIAREVENRLSDEMQRRNRLLTQRVINGTGVVLHTNLGRAPLSEAAIEAIRQTAGSYCNLEYDLDTGNRGRRGAGFESIMREFLGAEAVAVVNNCAAAVYLTLNALAEGSEVIVSRGELIEIGGSFRLPDVIAKSGARIREVGTTNRTRLSDFREAINENTRVILRSHPSNFRIVGFTERPELAELSALARENGVTLFEDLGSGALIDLEGLGIAGEPTAQQSLKSGVDIVAFSGDKLLGGPQAGIIAGSKSLVDKIRSNPMMRAFRVDKIIYAALEATVAAYARGAALQLPSVHSLSLKRDEIARRARRVARAVRNDGLKLELIDGDSVVGGGSAPEAALPTKLIRISSKTLSAAELEEQLRRGTTPVIARIADDQLVIDLRTVAKAEEKDLVTALERLG